MNSENRITMVFRFLILSDEVDDFKREILIDSEATFQDLQNAILASVGFTNDQITTFFICEDDWSKQTEVTLMEMDTNYEDDTFVMDVTKLEELLEDEKQKLLFVFDMMAERAFFMELLEILPGKSMERPKCSLKVGDAPVQVMSFEEFETKASAADFGENFYGDEEFDMDELDHEGYENLSDDMLSENPYDDRY